MMRYALHLRLSLLVLLAGSGSYAFLPQTSLAFTLSSNQKALPPLSSSSDTRDENVQAETLAESQQEKWRDATILSSRPACASGKSTFVQLQVDAATQQEYTIPGQFVQFRYQEEDPIFLAIASAPDVSNLEFLIKMAPRLTWLADALVEGTTVQVSRVMGQGFPLEDLSNRTIDNIILAAAGSGIAPLKACIESGKLPPHIKLYYGEWKKDDLCFTELYESWNANLVPVLSRTKDTKGYVQSVLQQDGVSSPETTGAILCGMDEMVESCTTVLTEAGVNKENILLNL